MVIGVPILKCIMVRYHLFFFNSFSKFFRVSPNLGGGGGGAAFFYRYPNVQLFFQILRVSPFL